ncbi:MAG: hypothetical protein K940chlam7_00412 [Chlamydiae bacterium]|nr:hypothetical protein [Chlamydiota bacterium]
MSNKIDFITAVKFDTNTFEKKTIGQKAVENFDDYFFLKGKKAQVIKQNDPNNDSYTVESAEQKTNIPLNILKVISYCTIAIPLIMLIGKAIARACFHNSIEKKIVSKFPQKEAKKSDEAAEKAGRADEARKALETKEAEETARKFMGAGNKVDGAASAIKSAGLKLEAPTLPPLPSSLTPPPPIMALPPSLILPSGAELKSFVPPPPELSPEDRELKKVLCLTYNAISEFNGSGKAKMHKIKLNDAGLLSVHPTKKNKSEKRTTERLAVFRKVFGNIEKALNAGITKITVDETTPKKEVVSREIFVLDVLTALIQSKEGKNALKNNFTDSGLKKDFEEHVGQIMKKIGGASPEQAKHMQNQFLEAKKSPGKQMETFLTDLHTFYNQMVSKPEVKDLVSESMLEKAPMWASTIELEVIGLLQSAKKEPNNAAMRLFDALEKLRELQLLLTKSKDLRFIEANKDKYSKLKKMLIDEGLPLLKFKEEDELIRSNLIMAKTDEPTDVEKKGRAPGFRSRITRKLKTGPAQAREEIKTLKPKTASHIISTEIVKGFLDDKIFLNNVVETALKNIRSQNPELFSKLLLDKNLQTLIKTRNEKKEIRHEAEIGLGAIREFVKYSNLLEQAQKDLEAGTTTKERIGNNLESWKKFRSLHETQLQTSQRALKLLKNLREGTEEHMELVVVLLDLKKINSSSDPLKEAREWAELHKSPQDCENGVMSSYTKGFGDDVPFLSTPDTDAIILGHKILMEKDPTNKENYEQLIAFVRNLSTALAEASKSLKQYYETNEQHKKVIKNDVSMDVNMEIAIQKLRDDISEIPKKLDNIKEQESDHVKCVVLSREYLRQAITKTLNRLEELERAAAE